MIPPCQPVYSDRSSASANHGKLESPDPSHIAKPDTVVAVNSRISVGTSHCTVTERPLITTATLERTVRKLPCVEHPIAAAFERAIEEKNPEQLLRLVARHPSLIEQYPACLLLADEEGKTLVHRMGASDYTLLLRKALNTEQGKHALCTKDHNGDTVLHHAARAKTSGSLDVIIASGAGAQSLLEQNKEGLLPLHIAVLRGYISSSIKMMNCVPETLITMDNSHKTPLHCLEFTQASERAQLAFLKVAIEKPCVRERLNHLLFFLNLHSTDAQCEKRIQQLRTSVLPAFRPVIAYRPNKETAISKTGSGTFRCSPVGELFAPLWNCPEVTSTLPMLASKEKTLPQSHGETEKRKNLCLCDSVSPWQKETVTQGQFLFAQKDNPLGSTFIQAMDLSSTVSSGSRALRHRAKQVLQWLGEVGVYGTFFCMKREQAHSFIALGDENVSVQLVNQLVGLGAPKIQLRLSPPWHQPTATRQSEATGQSDNNADPESAEGLKTERLKRVELNKLALLLPGFDPDRRLPQCFRMGQSTLSIVQCDDGVPEPAVVFSFLDLPEKHQQHTVHCDHYMVVKPYRFDSTSPDGRVLYTDFDGLNLRKIPLHLPPNSLLPEPGTIRTFTCDRDERQWIREALNASPINSPLQAKTLGRICTLCRQGHIHLNVIYGLKHQDVLPRREQLLGRWIDALQKVTQESKPTLILTGKSQIPNELPDNPGMAKTLVIIDSESEEVEAQLGQFSKHKAVAICLLPDLPKPVFHHLITASDLPVLTEGANTTSFLLQTGHPYLSTLPDGETPIPQDMGYPLEALKIEALSYKLRINETEQQLLQEVYSLICHGHYQEAMDYLDDHKTALADLRFINDQQHQAISAVTVRSLLKKGVQKRLGTLERVALLAATNPSVDALVEYIHDCLDGSSVVAHHFALQRMHVGHDFNNALIATLVKFARIKQVL
ncbi:MULTISPECIES: hypothetical protein [unclassified Endozoicomonas]|uniref:hypothetical protein n=1 Tax=unclassified Endozoicomonas TaxID=2644528 RepID=UPI003BB4F51F